MHNLSAFRTLSVQTSMKQDGDTKVNDPKILLQTALKRGRDNGLPYAGAVTPQEAHAWVVADPNVMIVDVRTNAERDWIGKVQVNEGQHAWVQWNLYPGGVRNAEFLTQLKDIASPDRVLLFLCRSGVRSRHAAALAAENGYRYSFDVLEGFEGDKDAHGHRKTVNGWCHAGLPWLGA